MSRRLNINKCHRNVQVLIPALNEEQNIGEVVSQLKELSCNRRDRKQNDHEGRKVVSNIIVCDNGSTDSTASIATQSGAHVVVEQQPGYGAACLKAIEHLKNIDVDDSDIIVFVDGDQSVCVPEIDRLIDQLNTKQGLVIGSRQTNKTAKGAISLHQRMGNIIAAFMIRLLWKVDVTDLGPFRAISYKDLISLDMQDKAFGWTTEMQIKAIQLGLNYSEVSVSTNKRRGRSKISGTLSGTIGAAYGIFSTIFIFWWRSTSENQSNPVSNKITH